MKKNNITLVDIIVVIIVSCLFYCTYRVYLKDLVVDKLETTINTHFEPTLSNSTGNSNGNTINENIINKNIIEGFNNYQGYSQSLIDQRHQKLDNDLKKFRNLNLPININDYGNKCQSWNTDPLDRFPNGGDSCKLNGNDAICMDMNNKQTTCNKLYDITVRELSKFDIPDIINSEFSKLQPVFKDIDSTIFEKDKEISNLVDTLTQLKNTNNQQSFFVDSNKTFLLNSENRENLIKNINETKNNSYNINSNSFQESKHKLTSLESSDIKFNQTLKWLFIIFIFIAIFYLLSRLVKE
jgi:hypothetical protein